MRREVTGSTPGKRKTIPDKNLDLNLVLFLALEIKIYGLISYPYVTNYSKP